MRSMGNDNGGFRKRLGLAIAERRADKGMSQRQFALVLELDRVTLNRIESGNGNPTLGTLERIAAGLDLTLEELFDACIR
ncbi:MAG: helix-turn-helix transcriptional regulator [Coriobacteriales bacterium]|jgi:transcriptional regulator with XRE-family HTH domain